MQFTFFPFIHSETRFRPSFRIPVESACVGYSGSVTFSGNMYLRPPPRMTYEGREASTFMNWYHHWLAKAGDCCCFLNSTWISSILQLSTESRKLSEMPPCQCLHRSLCCERAGKQCQCSPRWQLRPGVERQNTSLGRQSVHRWQPERRVVLWLLWQFPQTSLKSMDTVVTNWSSLS